MTSGFSGGEGAGQSMIERTSSDVELAERGLSLQACVVRHVAFEDLGNFGPVLAASGFDLSIMEAGVDDVFEPIVRSDLVVILGGPIGVYEQQRYPFLKDELRALTRRLREGRPTLGICLGAQLMAAALGARVYAGEHKEIGYAPLELTDAGRASSLGALAGQPVLHWHGDTFDLPTEAVRLAQTVKYANQAFSLGPNVLALQFHPEVDALRFEQWLIGHGVELAHAGIDVSELRAAVKQGASALRSAGTSMLGHWLEQVEWQ
jgi:GMP synthase (glutamine-hydrolysing)